MFAAPSGYEYKALQAPADDHEHDDYRSRNSDGFGLRSITFIVCVLCTVVNALSLLHGTFRVAPSFEEPQINLLRRPSQFMGLEQVSRPSPPIPRQFRNYPILLTQIDGADRQRTFEEDPKRYLSHVGTIVPEDKRVQISQTVSTIAQFRAIDFGMESCVLELVLPNRTTSESSTGAMSVIRPQIPFTISIFRLNTTYPIDAASLSYESRPVRVGKLADVSIADGVSWQRDLACVSDELLAFEMTCSTEDSQAECYAEWWQNRDDPEAAFFITQHSTV